jgi:hypothetical protein
VPIRSLVRMTIMLTKSDCVLIFITVIVRQHFCLNLGTTKTS